MSSLDIGTPAMVNFRSLGVKKSGHVYKIVRYFDSGQQNRYFAKFPKAEGDEVYVLVKVDDDPVELTAAGQPNNDKFFGCHVGEDVIVSLGETVVARLTRYSKMAVDKLAAADGLLSASALFDKGHRLASLQQ